MSFIIGLIIGFVSFPIAFIVTVLIYGNRAGWGKSLKNKPEYKGNIDYFKDGKTVYVDKGEINKIINKSKMC